MNFDYMTDYMTERGNWLSNVSGNCFLGSTRWFNKLSFPVILYKDLIQNEEFLFKFFWVYDVSHIVNGTYNIYSYLLTDLLHDLFVKNFQY